MTTPLEAHSRLNLSWGDVETYSKKEAEKIATFHHRPENLWAFPVPNGGIPAVQALQLAMRSIGRTLHLINTPDRANFIYDDIIDSGATRQRYAESHPATPFYALIDKSKRRDCWVEFPWEAMQKDNNGPEDNIRRILQYIGEDATREGLLETPKRVVKAYDELFAGYKQNPADIMKTFTDGTCDEMVLLRDISIVSFCEHHMLPFEGIVHVAYIPNGRIVGISKLARIVDIYSKRLQVQERLTQQITNCIMEHLQPKGAACVVEAHHSCMSCRGVKKQTAKMVTSSLLGVFRNPEVRLEFLSFLGRR